MTAETEGDRRNDHPDRREERLMIRRTVAEIEKDITACRKGIERCLNQGGNSSELTERVNQLAGCEGRLHAARLFEILTGNGVSDVEVRTELVREVTRGPDDTWSGRGNDVRRAYYEGICSAVANLLP